MGDFGPFFDLVHRREAERDRFVERSGFHVEELVDSVRVVGAAAEPVDGVRRDGDYVSVSDESRRGPHGRRRPRREHPRRSVHLIPPVVRARVIGTAVERRHRLVSGPRLDLHEIRPRMVALRATLLRLVDVLPSLLPAEHVVYFLQFTVRFARYRRGYVKKVRTLLASQREVRRGARNEQNITAGRAERQHNAWNDFQPSQHDETLPSNSPR